MISCATFHELLDRLSHHSGFAASASVSLTSPEFDAYSRFLSERYSDKILEKFPEYIKNSAKFKRSPARFMPWAKTLVVSVGCFDKLPEHPNIRLFRLAAPDSELSGRIAGYAMRADYHVHGNAMSEHLFESLKNDLKFDSFLHRIYIDASPLPERAMATFAKLGMIARNGCLKTPNHGSGVFISTLFLDTELPQTVVDSEYHEADGSSCGQCGKCSSVCPSGILPRKDNRFDYTHCIAAVTGEIRSDLTRRQIELAGNWVFGCGQCVSACPGSNMPSDLSIDLEWLLFCPSAELKRAITGTVMEHAGIKLIRRNALSVLFNRNTPAADALINEAYRTLASDSLRAFAGSLIEMKQI